MAAVFGEVHPRHYVVEDQECRGVSRRDRNAMTVAKIDGKKVISYMHFTFEFHSKTSVSSG
jgi:hypothetical protein